ncbi:hypothetical protein G3A56_09160 [Rhizobium oryzihabitans]|uniref:Uncharacterized protein n=1 Tax=Rhizobium oryzihabitans TaxID=2267833 RepID=A0A7L5BGU8_9HYPH|nr:hypothetical protein [Rhizobium oryzihabitans]QIB38137.1 hypothetical protein G3A56_09160 [Rhizobium oryzihabitans]
MGEVVYKDGDRILSERGQNQDCIECLEGLLEKAKGGEICGVAVAIQYSDRSTGETVAGFIWNRCVIGSLAFLTKRLTQD